MNRSMNYRWGVVAAVAVLLTGCGGSTPDSTGAAASPSTSPSVPPRAYVEVAFTARDGEPRSGRLFGEGRVGVVLSYMGRPGDSQDDWAAFAEELAGRGYLALTYQRRSALGEVWQDVLGGADQLRAAGAERVVAAGASIGAMASLYAAEQPDSGLQGVIWFAGVLRNRGYHFQEADVAQIACPILFLSGDEDPYGAAEAAQRLHEWATAPSDLLILPSRKHGTDIFAEAGPNPGEATRAMLGFVDGVAEGTGGAC